ncbi:hypothetical protein C453_03389 [Haloferax elongans ATCC BAA-1513]|uniref:DUF8080 domain-containing protein n=1 Tax=Haloferax elongans ATCC BAA-1513 TaxID=1230453 RepID=M0HUK4_HALEO|nr:hypothetical protein [Haloferax elongans]ELZ87362.1 hypothetical protein C453_03389 [Haloferax elongans ATCC BAA-1513]
MDFDVDVSVADAVALVTVRFDNTTPVDQRVRLRNRLDGPVLPPRRSGVPEDGWDETGFEGVVPADSTLAVGYACAVDGSEDNGSSLTPEDAVSVDVLGRDDPETIPQQTSPEDAIRELGPCRPPADVVPTPQPTPTEVAGESAFESESDAGPVAELELEPESEPAPETASVATTDDVERAAGPVESPTDEEVAAAVERETPSTEVSEPRTDLPVDDVAATHSPADDVEATYSSADDVEATYSSADDVEATYSSADDVGSYLTAVERRIELAERLDGASVEAAATALASSEAEASALSSLAADRDELRRLAARATALADRAADADPDTDALRRLA